MTKRTRITFLLIGLTQGLHSIEEAYGKLWEIYPPATYITGLVSSDKETGFIIINISLFVVLMLISMATFGKNFSATWILWFWLVLETVNGTGHIIWTIIEGAYTPGVITAPILLFLSLYLARLRTKEEHKDFST